jgi:hypothetical protein
MTGHDGAEQGGQHERNLQTTTRMLFLSFLKQSQFFWGTTKKSL